MITTPFSKAQPQTNTVFHYKRLALLEASFPQSGLPFPWHHPWTAEFDTFFRTELKKLEESRLKVVFRPVNEIIMADRDRENFRTAVYAQNLQYGREHDILVGTHEMSCMALRDCHDQFTLPNILLCSYINITPEFQQRYPRISGITLVPNFSKTIALGLSLIPEAQEILFITDDEDVDPQTHKDSMDWVLQNSGQITPAYRDEQGLYHPGWAQAPKILKNAKITWVSGTECTSQEMLEVVRKLPEKSFIVLSNWRNYYRDGYATSPEVFAPIIAKDIPIFSFNRVSPEGTVGGYIPRAETCAKKMALLVKQIFESPAETTLPAIREEGELVIDLHALKHFGLKKSKLPSGAILLNSKPPVWDVYRQESIIAAAAFAVILSLLIILEILHKRYIFYTRRTETVLNALPLRIDVSDENWNLLFHQADEVIRKKALPVPKMVSQLPDIDVSLFQNTISEVMKTGQPRNILFDHWGRKRQGTYFKLDDSIFKKQAVMWFSQDVTELENARLNSQKLAKERLGMLESLRYSSELAQISYFHLDESNNVILDGPERSSNPNWEMSQGKVVPAKDWVLPEDLEKFQSQWKQLLEGKTNEMRISYRSQYTGKLRYYTLIAARNENQILGAIQDITLLGENERKLESAMHEAQAANRAKTYFISTISHELRTPLNSVIGFSEILQMGDIDPEDQREYLEAIRVSGNNLLNLVNDLLDFSKMESGKLLIHPSKIDFSALLEEIYDIFKLRFKDKSIHFEVNARTPLPPLYVDALRLKQVLLNLLGNAFKFTLEGSVRCEAEFIPEPPQQDKAPLGTLILRICDTGIGVKKEFLEKIFEPFVQADEGLTRGKRPYEGTGLGLSISKQIVMKMGGTLSLTSQEGKGSVFTIEMKNVQYESNK